MKQISNIDDFKNVISSSKNKVKASYQTCCELCDQWEFGPCLHCAGTTFFFKYKIPQYILHSAIPNSNYYATIQVQYHGERKTMTTP